MATYKIDRASSLQYSGKFKFDYRIDIGPPPGGGGLFQLVTAGAYAEFILKSVKCSMLVGDNSELSLESKYQSFPWGGFTVFGNFVDGNTLKIPITFAFETKAGVLSDQGVTGRYKETIVLYTEPFSGTRPDKTLSGSIEENFLLDLAQMSLLVLMNIILQKIILLVLLFAQTMKMNIGETKSLQKIQFDNGQNIQV